MRASPARGGRRDWPGAVRADGVRSRCAAGGPDGDQRGRRVRGAGARRAAADLVDDAELEAGLRALEAPALAVFGTEDRVSPPELGRTYNEIIPRCHFVLVYDAGHAVAEERPEALA